MNENESKNLTDEEKGFMETYGLTEEEMVFFKKIYRKERIFKTVIAIETAGILLLSFLLLH